MWIGPIILITTLVFFTIILIIIESIKRKKLNKRRNDFLNSVRNFYKIMQEAQELLIKKSIQNAAMVKRIKENESMS